MSEAWSQLREIDRLSDGQVDIDFAIPVAEFARLPAQPAGSGELLRGRAEFRRERGFAVVALVVEGGVQLVCQRCLKPMREAIDSEAHIALVASDAEADNVPPELEPVRAPEGRVRVKDLVEEEVLLTLPIVPLHRDTSECVTAAPVESESRGEGPMQKPFEQLGELLKRK